MTKLFKQKIPPKKDQGMVLILVLPILMIFSVTASSYFSKILPNDIIYELETRDRLDKIRKATAIYAQNNHRIPCPIIPNSNNDSSELTPENNSCSSNTGIVPHQSLMISKSLIYDRWGNYFTYKVNPHFTQKINASNFKRIGDKNNPLLIASDKTLIHQLCRTPEWVSVNQEHYLGRNNIKYHIEKQNINKNLKKALFCCGLPNADSIKYTLSDNKDRAHQLTFGENLSLSNVPFEEINFLEKNEGNYHKQISHEIYKEHKRLFYEPLYPENGLMIGTIGPYDGSFFKTTADFSIINKSLNIDTFSFQLINIEDQYLEAPLPITLEIVDKKNKVSFTSTLIFKITHANKKNFTISVNTLLALENNPNIYDYGFWNDISFGQISNNAMTKGKERINKLMSKNSISIEDFKISSIKIHAMFLPLYIHSVELKNSSNKGLVVYNKKNIPYISTQQNPSSYDLAHTVHHGAIDQSYKNIAYAIISHGKNGEGAYTKNNFSNKINFIKDEEENKFELENHSNTNVVYDVTNQKNFDDIVAWDTSTTLLDTSQYGSCNSPH